MEGFRKIIHVDMDAFYASVAMLDHPQLRGKPLIVGGNPESRGVVSAASYEARKYGVHSAMACSRAKRLCPQAIFIRPQFERYREISRQVHTLFRQCTNVVESLALDEAWLDVTRNHWKEISATRVAQKIKTLIQKDLGLTCSVGVSYNKFLAKIATEVKKPNGLYVIPPDQAQEFLWNMEVTKIPGVGKVTAKKLESMNIIRGKDLYAYTLDFLEAHFGKFGKILHDRVRGIDHRPVISHRERKSVSVENTFPKDILYSEELIQKLDQLIEALWVRIQNYSRCGKTITLKIKFLDFHQITRNISWTENFTQKKQIRMVCKEKLEWICQNEYPSKPIRLLGIGLSNFGILHTRNQQLDFYQPVNESMNRNLCGRDRKHKMVD